MTLVFIYARFSPRPDADTCDSAEKQIKRCEEYAKRKGYQISNFNYTDENISGGVFKRPKLSRAIENLAFYVKENVNSDCILLVDSPDRLARDVLVYLTIRQQVADAGGRIEYADGSPPDGTPEGELLLNIMAAFAQYERARIRHRTRSGLKKKQKEGKWLGKPPIGYQLDKPSGKLVPCLQERDAIRWAKRWHLEDEYSAWTIAQKLKKEFGLFRGKQWSERTIKRAIKKIHAWESFPPEGESDVES